MPNKYKDIRPTLKMALEKGANYCAYQERCQHEVRQKLYELKLDSDDVEEVLMMLIQDDFVNEERFAKAYCRGKFNQNKWGRTKIIQGLKQKKVSERCIRTGLKEIDIDKYQEVLVLILEKKRALIKDKNQWVIKKKLLNYAIQKGYEYEIIQNLI